MLEIVVASGINPRCAHPHDEQSESTPFILHVHEISLDSAPITI